MWVCFGVGAPSFDPQLKDVDIIQNRQGSISQGAASQMRMHVDLSSHALRTIQEVVYRGEINSSIELSPC